MISFIIVTFKYDKNSKDLYSKELLFQITICLSNVILVVNILNEIIFTRSMF